MNAVWIVFSEKVQTIFYYGFKNIDLVKMSELKFA